MKHFGAVFVFFSVIFTLIITLTSDITHASILPREAREMGFRTAHELHAYFDIQEVTVTENTRPFSPEELAFTDFAIANTLTAPPIDESIGGLIGDLAADLGDIKKWVTLGLKIWDVVKNNQPVVSVTTQTVSVLPETRPDWRTMETWKGPQAKSYTIAATNLYGVKVISHTYTIAFHYGGSQNGRGHFLANATILPTAVDVSWGFTLNSNVKVGEALNTGTTQNPIPGIDLGLEWSMSSMLKKTQGIDQFYVRGDGTTAHVNR